MKSASAFGVALRAALAQPADGATAPSATQAVLLDPFSPTPLLSAALSSAPSQQNKKRPAAEVVCTQPLPAAATCSAAADSSPATPSCSSSSVKRQDVGSASSAAGRERAAQPPPEIVLGEDERTALLAMRKPLRDASLSEESRKSKCARGMQQLFSYSDLPSMRIACEVIDAVSLPDEALLCACQAAASADVSARAAAAFTAAVLRPRLAALEQPASRTLFSALLLLLQQHARPLLEELVVPSLYLNAGALSAGQAEALARLLKETPQALLGKAIADFLAGEGGVPQAWTEAQVALLQAILQRKPALEGAALGELVVQIDANVEALRKSLKFSNLLSTLVRSHGPQLRSHLASLRRIAERLETFQRKSILATVAKLEAEAG